MAWDLTGLDEEQAQAPKVVPTWDLSGLEETPAPKPTRRSTPVTPLKTVGRDVLLSNAQHDLADQIPGAADRLQRAQGMSPSARVPFSMHSDPVDVSAAAMRADPAAFDATMHEAAVASRHRARRPDLGQRLVGLANRAPQPAAAPQWDLSGLEEAGQASPKDVNLPASTAPMPAPAKPTPSPLDTVGPAATMTRAGYAGQPAAANPSPIIPGARQGEPVLRSRTGALYQTPPIGTNPILDAPYVGGQQIAKGARELAAAATDTTPVTPSTAPFRRSRTGALYQPPPPIDPRTKAGLADIAEGAMTASTPLVAGAALGAPAEVGSALVKAAIASEATQKALTAAGVDPANTRLAADVVGAVAAGVPIKEAVRKGVWTVADATRAAADAAEAKRTAARTIQPEPTDIPVTPERARLPEPRPTQEPTPSPSPSETTSAPVAARPGAAESGGPVAPSPEPRPAVSAVARPPAPEFVPVGEEAKWDVSGLTEAPTPPREDVVDRVQGKLASGEQLGTEEARKALAERTRVEAARRTEDTLPTGETQPRLPGDVGAVRDRELPTPTEEVPFALTSEAAQRTAVQPTLPEEAPRKFSSTQIELPAEHAAAVRNVAQQIPDADLAEDGREEQPHVTVKFGLHTNEANDVRRLLANEGPIVVRLGKTSIFPAKDGAPYDVVKVDVDSPDLHRLNAKIANALPHTDTHPEYKPHVTLAYVKPGLGKRYAGSDILAGREMTVNAVTFSGKDKQEISIPLGGPHAVKTRQQPIGDQLEHQGTDQPREHLPTAQADRGDRAVERPSLPGTASGADAGDAARPQGPSTLNTNERRELKRMLAEMQNLTYTPALRVEEKTGTQDEVWRAGAGGAPVFHDIGGNTRAAVTTAIQRVLAGKKPNAMGLRAIAVARARIADMGTTSRPSLPLAAGESGVPEGAGPEQVRTWANDRVKDPDDLAFLVRRYNETRDFGNIVSRDNAKELFYPQGTPETRTALNEPVSDAAGKVADAAYAARLKNPPGQERLVVGLSGGTGSGKSTAAVTERAQAADVVYDSQGTDAPAMERRIRQAKESGRRFEHLFVYRDPLTSWNEGVLPRADETGRPVSIVGHVASHEDALKATLAVAARHETDPAYQLRVVDNSVTPSRMLEGLDAVNFLQEKAAAYNAGDVERDVRDATESANRVGLLRPELYDAYTAAGAGVANRGERGAVARRGDREASAQPEAAGVRPVARTGTDTADVSASPSREVGQLPVTKGGTTLQSAVIPGAKEFVEQDVTPALKTAFDDADAARKDLRTIFAPDTAGPGAQVFGGTLRVGLAAHAQRVQRVQRSLRGLEQAFDRLPNEHNLKFIDAIETDAVDELPADQRAVARQLSTLLQQKRQQVQARGKLQNYLENYFPHEWKQPGQAVDLVRRILGRKPLKGPATFLKQRTIPTVREGIEAGLEPTSYNPVTLTLHKIAEMDKWIMAHDVLTESKELGVAKYVPSGQQAPKDWQRYHDSFGTVYAPPFVTVKEAFDAGLMAKLHDFATSLGITSVRKVSIKGGSVGSKAWGYAVEPSGPVVTKFAGPETVLMHEIGHVLDWKYHLWDTIKTELEGDRFDKTEPNPMRDLRALADLRYEGQEKNVTSSFKSYVRQKEEKIANLVHAFIYDPEKTKQVAPNAYWALYNLAKDTPELEPLIDIQKTGKSLVLGTNEAQQRVPGTVIAGHYYGPPDAVRLLNNHLSAGLRGNAAFDAYRSAGNFMNQVQLGLSAFHMGMTGLEAVISKAAQGVEELSRGEIRHGAASLAESPFATLTTLVKGDRALKQLYAKDANTRTILDVTDQIVQGGGGVLRDKTLKAYDDRVEGMLKAWRQGNVLGATMRAPFAGIELGTKAIMEQLVPRLKLGAYLDLARMELRSLGPNPDLVEVRRVLGNAWDSIDNRFGQLVYDNLFWHNALKDLGMASVRALGWNIGTVREVFGAPLGQAAQLGAKLTGERVGSHVPTRRVNTGVDAEGRPIYEDRAEPAMTHKMAYTIALPIVVGLTGALYNYAHTGEAPKSLADYYAPRTGRKRPDGKDERVFMPSYWKDVYASTRDLPGSIATTIAHKANPVLTSLIEMWQNEDYYGNQIRNEDDPRLKRIADTLLHAIPVPFSLQGYAQRKQSGGQTGVSGAESAVGITPAPASVYRSKAEDLMRQYMPPQAARTLKQQAKGQERRDLRDAIRQGDPEKAREALAAGRLGRNQIRPVVRSAAMTPLQAGFQHLSIDQALHVYQVATPEERGTLQMLLFGGKAQRSLQNAAPADVEDLQRRIQQAMQLPVGRVGGRTPVTR